jgi:hypothetical protein
MFYSPSTASPQSTGDTCGPPTPPRARSRPFACVTDGLKEMETGGNGTRQASLIMMFKLAQSAAKHWRKLNSPELILSLVEGKVFTDGFLQLTHAA